MKTCPKCQAENRPEAKFCARCGASMSEETAAPAVATTACPACGSANKPGARFCAKCGHNLTPQSSAPVARPVPAVAPLPVAPVVAAPPPPPPPGPTAPVPPMSASPPPVVAAPVTKPVAPPPAPAPRPASKPSSPVAATFSQPQPAVQGKKKFPIGIAIGAAVVVIAMIVGGVLIMRKSGEETVPVADSVPAARPPLEQAPAVTPADQAYSEPGFGGSGPESGMPLPATEPVPMAQPETSPPPEATADRAAAAADAAAQQILAQGKACMSRKQYDCAIANAKSVLLIVPGNADALALHKQAQDAQRKALSEIRIE